MKKYLLTIFTEKLDNDQFISAFAQHISPIVDSPQLKYQFTTGSVLVYFESEIESEEVYDFVSGVLFGVSDSYIMTEITDKKTVFMPVHMQVHLLEMNFGEKEELNSEEDYSIFAEEFIENLLGEFHSEVKTPTLNQLLDKISEKGLNSLTKFEKEILDNYSKN